MADDDAAAAKAAARKKAADDRRAAMRQMMRERKAAQQAAQEGQDGQEGIGIVQDNTAAEAVVVVAGDGFGAESGGAGASSSKRGGSGTLESGPDSFGELESSYPQRREPFAVGSGDDAVGNVSIAAEEVSSAQELPASAIDSVLFETASSVSKPAFSSGTASLHDASLSSDSTFSQLSTDAKGLSYSSNGPGTHALPQTDGRVPPSPTPRIASANFTGDSPFSFHPELGPFPVLGETRVDSSSAASALARLIEAAAASLIDAQQDMSSANAASGSGASVPAIARRLREEGGVPLFQAAQLLETTPEYSEKDADKLRFTAFRRGVEAGKAAEAALFEAKKAVGDEDAVGKSMGELQAYAESVLSQAAAAAQARAGIVVPTDENDALGIAQALIAEHARLRGATKILEEEARAADAEHALLVAASKEAQQKREDMLVQCAAIEQKRRATEQEYTSLKVRAEEALSIAATKGEEFKASIDREIRRVRAALLHETQEAQRLQNLFSVVKRDNADVHAVFEQIVKTHESVVSDVDQQDVDLAAEKQVDEEQDEY